MSENKYVSEDPNVCTRVTPSMVITGQVSSKDNLLIEGQVFGNIDTTGDLTSTNLTVGDIKANNASFVGARVKGSASLDGTLNVGDNTIMVGDVKAENVKVSGKIKGDLEVADNAVLTASALVAGDLTAAFVSTEAGARINGNIITRSKDVYIDLDKEFDLGIDAGGEF